MSGAVGPALSPARLDRKSLDAFLKAVRSRPARDGEAMARRAPGQLVEATEEQQQMWVHGEIAQTQLYNEPVTVHFDGELNTVAFERAFNCILDRHEAWRTSFEWRDGRLMQVVADHFEVQIPVVDLRSLPAKKREAVALEIAYQDSKEPFALHRLPLFKGRLFRMADKQFRFCLTLNHIIFDGVSLYRIFLPELQSFYAAFQNGTGLSLPRLPRQYADYALDRQQRRAEKQPQLVEHWARVLNPPAPTLELPVDFPRPAVRSFAGEMVKFALSRELSIALRETGEAESATLFMVLLAAYHLLIYSYTGACDQSVGTATSNRKDELTQQMLGLFLNTMVLRSSFLPSQSFSELLGTVRQTVIEAITHDDISFGQLVALFQTHRISGVNPLFQVMFSLEPPLVPLGPQWRFTQMDVETRLSKYDIHLEMDEREDGLIGRFIYSVELFRRETMEQWKSRWLTLLELIPQHPEWTIEEFVSSARELQTPRLSGLRTLWRRTLELLKRSKEDKCFNGTRNSN